MPVNDKMYHHKPIRRPLTPQQRLRISVRAAQMASKGGISAMPIYGLDGRLYGTLNSEHQTICGVERSIEHAIWAVCVGAVAHPEKLHDKISRRAIAKSLGYYNLKGTSPWKK